MAGFLDFAQNLSDFVPGGAAAIPSWLTGMLVKKPNINVAGIAPLWQQMAQQGAAATGFANQNADFFNQNYRPAAVAFNDRAQGVGGQADLNEASDRAGATFDNAFGARKQAISQDMAGVNPNSGGAMARQGALDAGYATGKVDAMNKGRAGREQYGDSLRATALPFLATQPNYGTGASIYGVAGQGMANLASLQNNMYRQEAGDTVKALKLPSDLGDEQARQKKTAAGTSGPLDAVAAYFKGRNGNTSDPSGGQLPQFNNDAGSMWNVDGGV